MSINFSALLKHNHKAPGATAKSLEHKKNCHGRGIEQKEVTVVNTCGLNTSLLQMFHLLYIYILQILFLLNNNIYIYICVCVCLHTHTHMYIYIHMCVCVFTHRMQIMNYLQAIYSHITIGNVLYIFRQSEQLIFRVPFEEFLSWLSS